MARPVAIVTGAGSGIGRETAIELSGLGWSLVLVGRTAAKLHETARLSDCNESQVKVMVADVGKLDSAFQIVGQTRARFGRLDGLINNAGLAISKPFGELEFDEIERMFTVNALGPVQLMRAAWEILAEGDGGRIVNVSSMATIDPFPGLGTYGAAKSALNGIGVAVAIEHADSGVRAFTVAPGAVETGMLRSIVPESALPREMTLEPAAVAEVIVACVTGRRDADAGTVIEVPSPTG
jgi:short-subunit dehydrogenase